jgi:Zn-finger nucleic acid-binding protein
MSDTAFTRTTSSFRPLDTTTTLRPPRLFCPSCTARGEERVLANATAGGIEFERCAGCGGTWFFLRDLDRVLAAAGESDWPEPSAQAAPFSVPTQGTSAEGAPDTEKQSEAPLACPCCAGRLVDVRDRHGAGIVIQRCLVCYGGWIDYRALQRAGETLGGFSARLGRLGRLLRGILQP